MKRRSALKLSAAFLAAPLGSVTSTPDQPIKQVEGLSIDLDTVLLKLLAGSSVALIDCDNKVIVSKRVTWQIVRPNTAKCEDVVFENLTPHRSIAGHGIVTKNGTLIWFRKYDLSLYGNGRIGVCNNVLQL